MADIRIRNDINVPEVSKDLTYHGHNPTKVFKLVPRLIKDIMRIKSAHFFEDEFKWDVSAEPILFFAYWRGRLKKDARTTMWINVRCQGEVSSKDNTGNVTLKIGGNISTKIPYNSFIDKALSHFYKHSFYSQQRREYIEEGRKYLEQIEAEIRKNFKMLEREA